MISRLYLLMGFLLIPFICFAWTPAGHYRLAEMILSHPTISTMLSTSHLNKDKILAYCQNGDFWAAHDLYQNGGWGTIESWQSFKTVYLNDAQIGNVRKNAPTTWKYIPSAYSLDRYYKNVSTVTPGATYTTVNAAGQVITVTDPPTIIYTVEKYWVDAEQMFGLFLHNLTDCAVPVGHSPARELPHINGDAELSFELDAENDPITDIADIKYYSFTKTETALMLPNLNQITESQIGIFWSSFCSKFETEMLSYAQQLKDHIAWYQVTESEWLSGVCFYSLLRFSELVTYKYLQYTKAYNTPGFDIPADMVVLSGKKTDISPIISLLLND
jgi:hypothetical protein